MEVAGGMEAMREFVANMREDRRARWAACVVLFVLGAVFVFRQSFVSDVTGYDALTERTLGLIDEGMLDNQRTFLIFSAVKASLAMIEGSTVGVGVEVQVGDLIQPAYDYVDYFWKIFLTAFVVMGFYKILLDAGMLTLGFPLMGFGLMILAGSLVVPTARWNARGLARRLMLFGLLMTYALPLSLLASDLIAERYVSELKVQHQVNIDSFQSQLTRTRGQFLALKEEISLLNPAGSLERVETGLVRLAQSVATSFQLSFLSFMYFVLIVLFEMLILPFCTAFILYLLGRRLMEGVVVPKVPVVQVVSPVEASVTK